jgi:MOSC domain-containing protein YiiM
MSTVLFLGGIRSLPPENKPTGIFKQRHDMPVWLGREGLAGDAQADRRVHGGPEKAFHQYPVGHYATLGMAFPDAFPGLVPGSMGENLSVPGWDETNIHIGDVFRLGDARIQVSQPRSPCWKIDTRHDAEGMARLIDERGLTGWYFRVVEEGEVMTGCDFTLLERPSPDISLAYLWTTWRELRPDPAELERLAKAPGLTQNWQDKLLQRASWLRNTG